jgi:hypothetical protein
MSPANWIKHSEKQVLTKIQAQNQQTVAFRDEMWLTKLNIWIAKK